MESDPGPGDDPGGSGTGGDDGGGGGTDPNDDPCNGNGVLTNPQQPGLTDSNGCTGIPTMPTLPLRNPCRRVKEQLAKPKYKSKVDSINNNTYYKKKEETGFREQKDGSLQDLTPNGSSALNIIYNANTLGYTHVHVDDIATGQINDLGMEKIDMQIRIHSPADINTLMGMADFNKTTGSFADLYGTMLSRDGTYVIKFTGTVADIKMGFNTEA